MPPPPSYIDITTLPFTRVVTQAEFNGGTFGGVANEVWFRFVTATEIVFGGVADKGGTFVPTTNIYASDGTSLLHTINQASHFRSWHFYFAAGTYYIKITRQGGGASNFDFTTNWDTRPILASVTPGDLIINDDAGLGFPAIVLDTSGNTVGFLPQIPSGEFADALPNGGSLWYDTVGFQAIRQNSLFDPTPTYINSFDSTPPMGANLPRITQDGTIFYFVNTFSGEVYTVTAAGVLGGPIATCFDIQANSIIGVNKSGTILFNADDSGGSSGVIRQWDLVNDVALANLYTIPGYDTANDRLGETAEGEPGEILCLSDGSIIFWWIDVSASQSKLTHVSSSGTLINEFSYAWATHGFDHIHYFTDELHIRTWYFNDAFFATNVITATYEELLLATGLPTASFVVDLFGSGKNLHYDSLEIWGPAESCMMVTYAYGSATPECPGLASQPRIDGLPFVPPVA